MSISTGSNTALATALCVDSDVSFTERLLDTRRNEIKAFSIALRDKHFLDFISSADGDEAFSDVVELAVKEYGVSQKEIALSANTTPSTVSRWMNKGACPPRFTRKSIVEAIGMIIDHNLDI